MQIEQRQWRPDTGWEGAEGSLAAPAHLVLAFGQREALEDGERLAEIGASYPQAVITGCSTAGEILGTRVSDGTIVTSAISFDSTRVEACDIGIDEAGGSREAGQMLGERLSAEDLQHVLVLSDGLHVNGSELVRGLEAALPEAVQITGGLAGDGEHFGTTLVVHNGHAASGRVAAIGFYGSGLTIGYGSLGGWDPFGPERLITRSQGNVLMELDGRSALELYKMYLGDYAAELPASALLFPLSLRSPDGTSGVVRTVLTIDEEREQMTFAGDVPEGSYARLMKANFERLIDGATGAAKASSESIGDSKPDLALLISCVGRKMVLQQRIEEEVESVREIFGDGTQLAGFYSYGEISPFTPSATCELHNQTMTITTFAER